MMDTTDTTDRCEFCGRETGDDGDCEACDRDWQGGRRLDGGAREDDAVFARYAAERGFSSYDAYLGGYREVYER